MTNSYSVDAGASRLTVQAFASGMLSGFAHSPIFAADDLRGTFRFDPDTPADDVFELAVRADSLRLTDKVKEQDRLEISSTMQNQVLEVGKYPEISFRSTAIAPTQISDGWYRLKIQGDMRLRGTNNPLGIDAQLRLGEEAMRLSGEFAISMAAYRLKPVSALGGMIKLKDELKFKFDLVGGRQTEAAI